MKKARKKPKQCVSSGTDVCEGGQRSKHIDLDFRFINDSTALGWPRNVRLTHSVNMMLPNIYQRIPMPAIEQLVRQVLQDGKKQLCNVKMLRLEGQGPQDTQLIQQLWQTMPKLKRLEVVGVQHPALMQHMTMLHQLTELLLSCKFSISSTVQKDTPADPWLHLEYAEARLELLSPLTNLRDLRIFANGERKDWENGSMSHLSTLVHLTHLDCWTWPLEMVARDLPYLTTLTTMKHLSFTGEIERHSVTKLYLDPLQLMTKLTCLELFSKTDGFLVGGWHGIGRPGNVMKRLWLRQLELIPPESSAPRLHWPNLTTLETWLSPSPLLLSTLQMHLQDFHHKAPPTIDCDYLHLDYYVQDTSICHDAISALRVLGVTSFTFYLHLHQLSLLGPLGQQLTHAKLRLAHKAIDRDLTRQHATALSAALPRLQQLELHDIGSCGGAEALLSALTELSFLEIVSCAAHVEAWRQAVRIVEPPGLVFNFQVELT